MAEENLPGKDDMAAIDVTALHALKELGGGDELVAEIVKTYLAHASSLVREFADSESIADAEAMLRIAHTLKSSSANVGAMRLSAMCAEMEASARAGRPCPSPGH